MAGHSATPEDTPRVIALPPLIFLAGLLTGFVAHWAVPHTLLGPSLRNWLAWPLLVMGVALASWGRRTLAKAGTNLDPRKPATALVTDGPFAWSRNPLYLSLTLIYLSIACIVNDLWFLPPLVAVLALIEYGVIRREERYLEAKFGDAYRAYQTRVRRWI
jgi:protein-S-isoprenylcysteine O-methyltransferase Ste14